MYTYNPKKITMNFGTHIASGYAEDSFVTIEPATDGTTYTTGADGEVIRSIDPSDIYLLKVSLLQGSATNEYLQGMVDMDKADGTGTFGVTITDTIGNESFSGATAWVTKPAAWGRGKAATNREWEIVVAGGKFGI